MRFFLSLAATAAFLDYIVVLVSARLSTVHDSEKILSLPPSKSPLSDSKTQLLPRHLSLSDVSTSISDNTTTSRGGGTPRQARDADEDGLDEESPSRQDSCSDCRTEPVELPSGDDPPPPPQHNLLANVLAEGATATACHENCARGLRLMMTKLFSRHRRDDHDHVRRAAGDGSSLHDHEGHEDHEDRTTGRDQTSPRRGDESPGVSEADLRRHNELHEGSGSGVGSWVAAAGEWPESEYELNLVEHGYFWDMIEQIGERFVFRRNPATFSGAELVGERSSCPAGTGTIAVLFASVRAGFVRGCGWRFRRYIMETNAIISVSFLNDAFYCVFLSFSPYVRRYFS